MILTKIETNIKRKLFLHKTEKIAFPTSSNIIEFDVISVVLKGGNKKCLEENVIV